MLARILPRLYPDEPDAESRFEALRDELAHDHRDDIAARLDLVLQDDLEVRERTLPITRREAALPGIWRFLAVVHRPDFVRHR